MSATAAEPSLAPLEEDISRSLERHGWWTGDRLFPHDLCVALAAETRARDAAGLLSRAGIGRGVEHRIVASIRRDRTVWLDRSTPAQQQFAEILGGLKAALNRRLFLGLFEVEAQFAIYPPGGFYRRHLDSFRGAANRVLSLVLYLNEGWKPNDGGQLRLFASQDDADGIEIEPRIGTAAIFLSEEIPHEVLSTRRERASIAAWFRVNASIDREIDPPR